MQKSDVEVLLFRVQAAYPMSNVATHGTLEEWCDATALMAHPPNVVLAAFSAWRDRELWPPKIPDLTAECAVIAKQRLADQQNRMLSEQAQDHDGLLTFVSCRECGDLGYVDAEGHNTVIPCMACRPEQYEIWAGGHWRPGHSCGACVARRLGRKAS